MNKESALRELIDVTKLIAQLEEKSRRLVVEILAQPMEEPKELVIPSFPKRGNRYASINYNGVKLGATEATVLKWLEAHGESTVKAVADAIKQRPNPVQNTMRRLLTKKLVIHNSNNPRYVTWSAIQRKAEEMNHA